MTESHDVAWLGQNFQYSCGSFHCAEMTCLCQLTQLTLSLESQLLVALFIEVLYYMSCFSSAFVPYLTVAQNTTH